MMKPCPAVPAVVSLLLSGAIGAIAAPAAQTPPSPPAAADSAAAPAAPTPVIRAVSVIGAHGLAPSLLADVAAREVFGKPGTADVVHAAVQAVMRTYRNRGFPVAEVVATDVSPDGVLRITVEEGTVRRIVIKGNRRTRRATILEAMMTRPGTVYQEDRAKEDRNRLARLGIFSDVVIAPVVPGAVSEEDEADDAKGAADSTQKSTSAGAGGTKGGDPTPAPNTTVPPSDSSAGTKETQPAPVEKPAPAADAAPAEEDAFGQVDVVVKVKEERTGNVAATVGYSDGTGLTGFLDLSEANFRGEAQQISAQWQRSSSQYYDDFGNLVSGNARQAFDVSFWQPLIGPSSLAYGVELYNKQTVFFPFFASYQDTIRNYETRRGATVRVGRAIGGNTSLYFSARHDKVGYDVIPSDLNPPYGLLSVASATVGALGVDLVLDGRDEADNPRHGYLDSLLYEQAGSFLGGDRAYGQAKADLREYFALTSSVKGPILATRILGGTTLGNEAPLSEYYFIGGYELLRGYNLYSIYGNKMILGSVELRTPISEAVQGVAFIDVGNAFRPDVSNSGLKSGVGLGLRFLSPIGPIRLDAAHGENGVQTYVSLGQSF